MRSVSTSPRQFAAFRVLLGAYLCVHFVMLVPYAPELWSSAGMLADAALVPTHAFPNLLAVLSAPLETQLFVSALAALALLFALGVWRRPVAVLLWYGWACLYTRNPLIANPGLPYVGWLLLASALIPEGEGWALWPLRPSSKWQMPRVLFVGAWLLFALGYTASGLHKLTAPSWRDGTAFVHVLSIPLARDTWLRELLLNAPAWALAGLTYGALALEVLVAPLSLVSRARPYVWCLATALQLGILTVVAFSDLTFGMLMIHAFIFDRRWLTARAVIGTPVVFFDGVCGLCNKTVDLLLREDTEEVLRFAPLQGDYAREKLPDALTVGPNSIVLLEDGVVYLRSDAALRIATALGGFWRLFAVFYAVPGPLRDVVYDFIARNRYRWFGKHDTCRLPTPAERARFL